MEKIEYGRNVLHIRGVIYEDKEINFQRNYKIHLHRKGIR